MEDLQPTITKNNQVLDKTALQVFRLRHEGRSYFDISKIVGVGVYTLQGWFDMGGRYYLDYKDYVIEENKFRKEVSRRILSRNVENAAKVLVSRLASTNERISLKAAIIILDRELGKPKEIIEDTTGSSRSFELLQQIVVQYEKESKARAKTQR